MRTKEPSGNVRLFVGGTEVVWAEIRVEIPVDPGLRASKGLDACLEAAHELIGSVAPLGYVQEASDVPPSELAPPAEDEIRFRVYAEASVVEVPLARLNGLLRFYPAARIAVHPVDPDWKESWKRFFTGFDVSPRLSVRPPWEDGDRPNAVIIEPGMAFGTGHHETTRLCLELIDRLYMRTSPPTSLLDVGCGTGILSIAAARLGGHQIVGTDCDPDAVRIAIENGAVNGAERACTFTTSPLRDLEGMFPIVVANIMAHILIDIRRELIAMLEPGGELYLSGILLEQVHGVVSEFTAEGLVLRHQSDAGEWALLEFARV
jgi:ribosomal protein L11 methyltransferase